MSPIVNLQNYNPYDVHTQNSALNVVVTLVLPPVDWWTAGVLIQAKDQNINFTLDGTDPTATFGFTLFEGRLAVLVPIGIDTVLKFIETTASATLEYQFITGV